MPLSVDPHHSKKSHGFFLYFSIFQLVSFYYIICMHAIFHFYHSSPSYTLFSISVAFCFDFPHPQQSSSYFHAIISLPLTCRHPPLTISLTLAPTLPSAKLSFLWHLFIFTYSFSLSVSLNPLFHASLPTPCIISQMYFLLN